MPSPAATSAASANTRAMGDVDTLAWPTDKGGRCSVGGWMRQVEAEVVGARGRHRRSRRSTAVQEAGLGFHDDGVVGAGQAAVGCEGM
jgi:hypothetical protein